MMAFDDLTKTKVAVLLLILFAFFTNSQLLLTSSSAKFLLAKISLFDAPSTSSESTSPTPAENRTVTPAATAPAIPRDKATWHEKRFAALKNTLSANAVVGYVTDKDGIYSTRSDYYLTQYVLAPVIVVDDINHEFVVGNFSHSAIIEQFATSDPVFCTIIFDQQTEGQKMFEPSREDQLLLTTPPGESTDFDGVPIEQCSHEKLGLIQDFGDGVALFKREEK